MWGQRKHSCLWSARNPTCPHKSPSCVKRDAASSLLLPPPKASTGGPLSQTKKKTVSQQSLSCLVCSSSHDVCEPQNRCHALCVSSPLTRPHRGAPKELVDEWWAQAAKESMDTASLECSCVCSQTPMCHCAVQRPQAWVGMRPQR